jgi:hypothetical protein
MAVLAQAPRPRTCHSHPTPAHRLRARSWPARHSTAPTWRTVTSSLRRSAAGRAPQQRGALLPTIALALRCVRLTTVAPLVERECLFVCTRLFDHTRQSTRRCLPIGPHHPQWVTVVHVLILPMYVTLSLPSHPGATSRRRSPLGRATQLALPASSLPCDDLSTCVRQRVA